MRKLLHKPVFKSLPELLHIRIFCKGVSAESPGQKNTPTTQSFCRRDNTMLGRCQPAPPRTLPVWADQWFYLFRNILSATHKECDETTRPTGKEARRTLPGIILLFYLTTNALMF